MILNHARNKVVELLALDTIVLRRLWREAFGRPPPKQMRRDLLLRALAYRVQEETEGGLSKAALRRLAVVAHSMGNDSRPPRRVTSRLKPGTRLVRDWQSEVHQVTVQGDGFDYRGTRYASLSVIAREITGARWSGPRFFGLRTADARTKVASDDR